ncbi:hypothetical protein CASFOL_031457 [Castilleja foliolosa]|uniref:F-box domain-containing protein n=1 Tax=Castilleja foliolosa TaxID=1961234 RepID=A0ABD3C654_9LAMI
MAADKRQKIEFELLISDPEIKKALKLVLFRLPVKDLARSKLVRKDWRDLIESPAFLSEHINRSSRKILVQDDSPWREPGPFNFAACCWCPYALIVGSINGLVCIVGNYPNNLTKPDHIWVLNPITGNAIELPPPASPMIVDVDNYDSITYAFVWDHSNVTSGYNVFKIVSKSSSLSHTQAWKSSICYDYLYSRPIDSNSVEVWCSDCPAFWREVPMNFTRPFYHPNWVSHCDAVVGGVAYWVVVDGDGSSCFVVSLDTKTLTLNSIPLPDISTPVHTLVEKICGGLIPNDDSCFFGTIWKGSFALIENERTHHGTHYYNVWRLDVWGWGEKFSFCMDFGIYKCFNSIESRLVLRPFSCLTFFYNTYNEECEVLRNNGFTEFLEEEIEGGEIKDYDLIHSSVCSVHDFVGSLLSIDGFKRFENFENRPELVFIWPDGSKSGAASGMIGNMNTNEDMNVDERRGKPPELDLSFLDNCFSPCEFSVIG